MEDVVQLIGIIFGAVMSLLIIGNIIHFMFYVFFSSLNFTYEKVWFQTHKKVPDKVQQKYAAVLLNHFTYYRNLSDASKQKFLFRINRFVKSKTFTGRKGLEVAEK